MYIDSNLVGTGKVAKAAIMGLQGGIWASSPGYTVRAYPIACECELTVFELLQLSTEEQNALLAAFKDPSTVFASGVRLAGQKFIATRAEDGVMQLKKQVCQ